MRPWPKSLAGQMILLLLLALIVSQGISLVIFLDERRHAVREAVRTQVLTRTVSVVRLLRDTPPELSGRIIDAASGPRLGFWIAAESAVDPTDPKVRDHPLHRRLTKRLHGSGARDTLVHVEDGRRRFFAWRRSDTRIARYQEHDDDKDDDDHTHRWRRDEHWQARRHRVPLSLTISVLLPDGRWLNAATLLPPPATPWAWLSLVSMAAMAVAIALIVALSVRRITRPMRALAGAADRFGRGQDTEPLPERGPEDVRRTIHAFNDMRDRLQRFVQDRTRMLAAISHDLRTPITSLRLRAEFIEDREIREKILETLDEMQQMAEAALAFAREDATQESTRRVDLAALVQSLCDDQSDAGLDVSFGGAERTPYSCRPVALKRALRNVIENAVAYGQRARVALRTGDRELLVSVEDEGPGIPEQDLERVFEPFLRLEESRSRDTGGVGLGLAIARSIVRGHGGDIVLTNRPEGGLTAVIRLPIAADG